MRVAIDYNKSPTNFGDYNMNLKLAMVFAAAAFSFSIAGAEAVTLSGSKSPGYPIRSRQGAMRQRKTVRRWLGMAWWPPFLP